MKKRFLTIAWIVVFLCGCTCDQVASGGVDTSLWYMDVEATSLGDGTTDVSIDVRVNKSSGNDVQLETVDELFITANGTTSKVSSTQTKSCNYHTNLNVDDPGTVIVMSLQRQLKSSAPNSQVTLPEALSILTPGSGETYSRADNLNITWEPYSSSRNILVEVTASCLENGQQINNYPIDEVITDGGSLSYPVSTLLENIDETATCTLRVTLTRENVGSLDGNFRDGRIIARRKAFVEVSIQP